MFKSLLIFWKSKKCDSLFLRFKMKIRDCDSFRLRMKAISVCLTESGKFTSACLLAPPSRIARVYQCMYPRWAGRAAWCQIQKNNTKSCGCSFYSGVKRTLSGVKRTLPPCPGGGRVAGSRKIIRKWQVFFLLRS